RLMGRVKLGSKRGPSRSKEAVRPARIEGAFAIDDSSAKEMQFASRSRASNVEDALPFLCFAHLALVSHPLVERMRVLALAADWRNQQLVLIRVIDADTLQHADQLLPIAPGAAIKARNEHHI